jgi:hypothetical protein
MPEVPIVKKKKKNLALSAGNFCEGECFYLTHVQDEPKALKKIYTF